MITSLKANGNEILPYIAKNGIAYQLVKKVGPNQGEAINGADILDIRAKKENLTITFRDLTDSEDDTVKSYFAADTVDVTYYSKYKQQIITKTFWVQDLSSGSKASYPDGSAVWSGLKIQLNAKDPI